MKRDLVSDVMYCDCDRRSVDVGLGMVEEGIMDMVELAAEKLLKRHSIDIKNAKEKEGEYLIYCDLIHPR